MSNIYKLACLLVTIYNDRALRVLTFIVNYDFSVFEPLHCVNVNLE
jgi:hypothetical protein